MENIPFKKIKKIPKIELHCHLDGSIRTESIIDQAKIDNVNIPTYKVSELDAIIKIGKNKTSLENYLKKFEITLSVMQSAQALERFAFELIEDVSKENVIYIEVRFSPILHKYSGMKPEVSIKSVSNGLLKGKKKYGVISGIIICGMRNMSPSDSLKLANLAIDHKNDGVVGFDLAGSEKSSPAKTHSEAFKLIKNNNLKCAIHAGEASGPSSIHQAIFDCKADRIGHGTRLLENKSLTKLVKEKKIPLEICLTSNWHTSCVSSLDKHPLKFYYDAGIIISINTDNRLISDTTLSHEMKLANSLFSFDLNDFKNITIMAIQSAFIKNSIKREIEELIQYKYRKILV